MHESMFNRIAITAIILSGFIISEIPAQDPVIKWWFDTRSFSAGQTAAADIDNDGKLELVFGCYRNDGGIYALNSEDGSLLWAYYPHSPPKQGCNDVAPVIYDIDADGLPEVIVPSSCTPVTVCLNGNDGSVKWKSNTRGSDSPPTIADMDKDGKPEILHGEFGGWVRCLNGEDGTKLWDLPVNMNSWIQTAPTIVDLNDDGQLDFVVGTWAFNKNDSIYAFDGNSRNKLWTIPVHNWMYHGTAVADFDDDKKPELVIGSYNDTLYCINGENGTTDWKYFADGSSISCPVSIGDLDNDGECDIVFTSWYKVIALTNKGKLKWQYNIPSYTYNFRGVVLSDINNDEFADVIFGTYAGEFIGLNGNDGSQIFRMDIASHYGNSQFDIDHAPVIADFDRDGILDAFFIGGYGVSSPTIDNNYGRAYMFSVGKGHGPDWLMFQHDIRRQSSLCFDYTTIDNDLISPEFENIIIYPNPSDGLIRIEGDFAKAQIDIFNNLGVKISSYYVTASPFELQITQKGIYLLRIIADGAANTKKIIIH